MADFLDMGRNSVFIWSSYGGAALLLLLVGFLSFRGQRKRKQELDRLKDMHRSDTPGDRDEART